MLQVCTFCFVDVIFKIKNPGGKFILIQKKVHIDFVASLVLHDLFLLVCEKGDDNESKTIIIPTKTQQSPEKKGKIQHECKFNI